MVIVGPPNLPGATEDRQMSLERRIRLIAGSFVAISVVLSDVDSSHWLFFTLFVGLNRFQSALTRRCPWARGSGSEARGDGRESLSLSRYIVNLALLLAACTGGRASEAPGEPPAVVAGVRLEVAERVLLEGAVDVAGTVKTKTQMRIASRLQGYVREVRARQGDHAEPGQVLVLLDAGEPSARVDRARAALAEAEMG